MSVRKSITAKTKILCIIGQPIDHSMSPIMHNAALEDLGLDYNYIAFNVPPNKLKDAVFGLKALDVKGINVTIPHKESIIKFLDEVDQIAQKIGAINTIKNVNGLLKGKNTDAEGAKNALLKARCEIARKNVLILGAGGAARAICYALSTEINKIVIVNRTENKAKELADNLKKRTNSEVEGKKYSKSILKEEIKDTDILINCTPIGMVPNITNTPISKEILHTDLFVFDVIYNPLETQLIKDSKDVGCQTLGGLDMLVNQGALAFEWWTGKTPNTFLMKNKIIEMLGIK